MPDRWFIILGNFCLLLDNRSLSTDDSNIIAVSGLVSIIVSAQSSVSCSSEFEQENAEQDINKTKSIREIYCVLIICGNVSILRAQDIIVIYDL
jgi:hypothetical protein